MFLFLFISLALLLGIRCSGSSFIDAVLGFSDTFRTTLHFQVVGEGLLVAKLVHSSVEILEHLETVVIFAFNFTFFSCSSLCLAECDSFVSNVGHLLDIRSDTLVGSWTSSESQMPDIEFLDGNVAFLGPFHEEHTHVHVAITPLIVSEAV